MNLRYLIPLGVFLVLSGFLAAGLFLNPGQVPSPLIGKPAPEFALPRLDDPAQIVSSKDFAGRKYVVNVWGPWCSGCQVEHADLMRIASRKVVPIVGLTVPQGALADKQGAPLPLEDVWSEIQLGLRWLRELGNPYVATGFDPDGRAGIDWGVYGAPETFLIGPDGTVLHRHVSPLTEAVWQRDFVPLIAQEGR